MDLLYELALCDVPQIGCVHARILWEHFGSAERIFKAGVKELSAIHDIGEIRARNIKRFSNFGKAEREISFLTRYGIAALFLGHPLYPKRLLNCYDPPTVLFFRGNTNLNAPRVLAIVGTRNNTAYGRAVVEKCIAGLAHLDVLIVSGLAFGIDSIAHRAALKRNMHTLAVLGHGLDTLYPPEHGSLAREMMEQGGLLSPFSSKTKPERYHFPARNRVVAGMSDAVLVVESATKGGSMITADLAWGYNRNLFAVPGKTTDPRSSGCNALIADNKACLYQSAEALITAMGWQPEPVLAPVQTTLAAMYSDPTITAEHKLVLTELARAEMDIDDIRVRTGLTPGALSSVLLELELRNTVTSMAGNRYRLSGR